MKHLLVISVVLISSMAEVFSQADFRNGYVVKNNNDTLHGLLDYKGNKANAKKCIFKADAHAEKQEFAPEDIKAYRFIDSKYYISRSIKARDQEELVFLEFLINGTVDIFYYRDELSGEHYLIENSDGQLFELKNEEKELIVRDVITVRESKEYIGVLKYTFKESPVISKQVENMSLNHKSLIDITHAYHNEVCINEECIIYEKKLPGHKVKFGLLLGVNVISFSPSEADDMPKTDSYFKDVDFGTVYHPSIGFFLKANMPFINEKLFFQYEVAFSYVTLYSYNEYVDMGNNLLHTNEISSSEVVFNNNILFRYEFPNGKVRPTIHVGGFYNGSFNTAYNHEYNVYYTFGDLYRSFETSVPEFSLSDFGFSLGFGIITRLVNNKDLFVDLRYQGGINHDYWQANYFSLNLGYQLF